MNKQYSITINAIDNGWTIRANGDLPGKPNINAAALTKESLIATLKDIADHIFDAPPAPPKR